MAPLDASLHLLRVRALLRVDHRCCDLSPDIRLDRAIRVHEHPGDAGNLGRCWTADWTCGIVSRGSRTRSRTDARVGTLARQRVPRAALSHQRHRPAAAPPAGAALHARATRDSSGDRAGAVHHAAVRQIRSWNLPGGSVDEIQKRRALEPRAERDAHRTTTILPRV